ncbi:MAG: glycoside hydrolase family 36 protein, partial [Acidimicrobiales bacterium]
MRLHATGIRAASSDGLHQVELSTGEHRLGPLAVSVETSVDMSSTRFEWRLANRSDQAVTVRSVTIVFELSAVGTVRMWRHGYQSWSPSGMARLGADRDPSIHGGSEVLRAAHHADQRMVTGPFELRSEWVTALADASGEVAVAGFEGSGRHDGTFRLHPDGPRLEAEAFLGDVVLQPGATIELHPLAVRTGTAVEEVTDLLEQWADANGRLAAARTAAAYQVGWCSWYQYFHAVTEVDILANLARSTDWPFDVFQVDDGYQRAIGDWLDTSPAFPSGLGALATRVTGAGHQAGIWLAPFLAAPDSEVATRHPDWLARRRRSDGSLSPLIVWQNPSWGGGRGGLMYCLDTTRPEVAAHLEGVARAMVELGYHYLKLDFTFAPSGDGVWFDSSLTPAQRVRRGYAAIRHGAGPDAFILACGAPLSHVVGLVDGARIGQDVAPRWPLHPGDEAVPGYLATQPATQMAWASTAARAFMHRRLWLNDPDCLMLRTSRTRL